jgi:diguanylate cyclase (GGDEF)-like protein
VLTRISCGYRVLLYSLLMMSRHSPTEPDSRRSVGVGILIAGLLAIVAGLLLPLVLGSFSDRQTLVLAIVEALCLVVVAAGIVLMGRRLQASHQALWALARRDELTGVGNYRGLQERLAEEIARHRRHSREFALVLLDLDGFKAVNERFGHLEGDRLLAEIGVALSDEVRAEDSVFRQGGDEFAVIVPEAHAEEAEEIAGRLRARIARRGFGSDEAQPISAATGFAMFPADGATAEALLGCADSDLFAAKRERRTA